MTNKIKWIVFVAISLISRFLFLSLRPLEGDEGIIVKIAQSNNLSDLFSQVARDVHPPLFHFLEFLVLKNLPLSEISARLTSALAGFVAVYFIYLVFKKISSHRVAFIVGIFSAINPVLTYHFAEARPYGLLVMLFFAQLYVFLNLLDKQKKRYLLGFFILSTLLILTQYVSFALIFGELLYLIIAKRKASSWQKIVSGLGAVIAFFAIWGQVFLSQLKGRSLEQSQAISLKDNLTGIFNAFYRFFSGRMFLDLDPSIGRNLSFLKSDPLLFIAFLLSVIVPLGLFIWGIVNLYKKKKNNFMLFLLIFLPVILAAMFSSEIGPRSARYLLFLAPVCIYIVAELYFQQKQKFVKVLFGIFALIYLSGFIHGLYFERKKAGVNNIAEYINSNSNLGDQIVIRGGFGGGEELVLRHYLQDESDYLISDMFSDYEVGNLEKIKSRAPWQFIKNIKDSDPNKSVWFYDMTYSFDETTIDREYESVLIGRDKENKDLYLYKF